MFIPIPDSASHSIIAEIYWSIPVSCRHHSTETSILHTLDSIFASQTGESTVVISLHLSPEFPAIDHNILLFRLNTSFRISDLALSWLQSYLTNRTSSVHIGRHCFSPVTCTTGIPQGSAVEPLLFTVYIYPIAGIACLHRTNRQQYADDTQLFISLSPSKYTVNLNDLTICIDALHTQGDQTSGFDRDSPGLRGYVPLSRDITFGTRKCPGFDYESWSGLRLKLLTVIFMY